MFLYLRAFKMSCSAELRMKSFDNLGTGKKCLLKRPHRKGDFIQGRVQGVTKVLVYRRIDDLTC